MTSLRDLYAHPRIPLWWRVVLYSIDHHGLPLQARQLRDTVDPLHQTRAAEISRAIKRGVSAGMLTPDSSAACLRFAPADEEEAA